MHRITASLLVSAGLTATAFAEDGNFTNLTTSGLVDFNGSTLAFGDTGTGAAFTLSYANPNINFASTLTAANWYWLQKTSEYQLGLTSANQLKIYDPTLKTVAITLDPAAVSTFAKGITINGLLSAQGGLTFSTTGTTAAKGLNFGDTNLYRSGVGILKTDKALQVGTNLAVGGTASVAGSTLTLGTNATTAGTGLTTTYTDGNPNATVTYAVSRAGAVWNFKQNGTAPQLQLDASNKLTLFNSSAVAGVVLNPASRSTISNGLNIGNGLLVPSGSVGIGTSSPERSLHVSSSSAWIRLDRNDDVNGPALLLVRKNAAATSILSSWLVGPTNTSGASGDDFAIVDYGTAVSGATGSTRLMIDKATGSVGIGTSAPTAKLDVAGTLTVSGDVKVKTVLRLPPAGDLSMGSFTTGTNPTL